MRGRRSLKTRRRKMFTPSMADELSWSLLADRDLPSKIKRLRRREFVSREMRIVNGSSIGHTYANGIGFEKNAESIRFKTPLKRRWNLKLFECSHRSSFDPLLGKLFDTKLRAETLKDYDIMVYSLHAGPEIYWKGGVTDPETP
ncbi:hypothetical protein BJ742DRAFT_766996 [Cladochytrium replicatum]|nr:hypothetical protein BJ742DRAFT_766996 [Cladochytrium replicatum]